MLSNLGLLRAEELLVSAGSGPLNSANSAAGGLETGAYAVPPEIVRVKKKLLDLRQSWPDTGVKRQPRPDGPDRARQALERLHDILSDLPREMTGQLVPYDMLERIAREASTIDAPSRYPGAPIVMMVAKDVTGADMDGITAFWDLARGSGPTVTCADRRWAHSNSTSDAIDPDDLGDREVQFVDFWSLNGRHLEELMKLMLDTLGLIIDGQAADMYELQSAALARIFLTGVATNFHDADLAAEADAMLDAGAWDDTQLSRLIRHVLNGNWEEIGATAL